MVSATSPGSRPKRAASFVASDLGVPMPGRHSLPGSRAAMASAVARGTGSIAKRARRGEWSPPRTKDLTSARCSRRAASSAACRIAATSVGTTCRLGCTGIRNPRRSRAKPTPRRDAVAPLTVRSRSGSRSSSSSSSVSTSPPSRQTASRTRRSSSESATYLGGEELGVAEHLPRGFERQGHGRRRGAAEVVRRDGARRLERSLREERAGAAWVLGLPRAELHQMSRGEQSSTFSRSRRANMSPRARSGSSAGGVASTNSDPRASATRWRQLDARRGSREGSRRSGSCTRARATCDGASMRLVGSIRTPSRATRASSSPAGSARRMSTRRMPGGVETGVTGWLFAGTG